MSQKRKHFKFRHVNELAGAFVLFAVVAIIGAVILAGQVQGWFAPTDVILVRFPEEGAFGVKKGAEVWLLNTVVGTVDWIAPGDDGVMEAGLRVQRNFMQFVKSDSEAIVKRKFELAGDVYVEISKGKGDSLPIDKLTLPIRKDTELLEEVRGSVLSIRDGAIDTFTSLRKGADEITLFVQKLNDAEGSFQGFLAKLDAVAAGLEEGEGTLGELLKNDVYVRELDDVLSLMDARLMELEAVILDLKHTTEALPSMAGTLGKEIENMPGLVMGSKDAVEEAKRLVKGLQKNFLVRKHIQQPKTTGRISPFELPSEAPPPP